jgi:hypothetical protein
MPPFTTPPGCRHLGAVPQSSPGPPCGLFSADEGTFCDGTFVGEIRSAREYVKIPQGVLPFARDGGGSVVYLDLSLEGNGRGGGLRDRSAGVDWLAHRVSVYRAVTCALPARPDRGVHR